MKYELVTDQALFERLNDNLQEIAGAVNSLVGVDQPFPDPRDVADMFKTMAFDEFITHFRDQKDEIAKNMDIQIAIAEITKENVEIQKELLHRV